jgi:hypothetical protein
MTGDFSRDTSRNARLERYTRVLLQQGRPLLDADFNEQSAIHHDLLTTFITDCVGRAWRPEKGTGGFVVSAIANKANDFAITKGRFYIDGMLCDTPRDRSYLDQPFFDEPPPLKAGRWLVYLECWQRHVCAVQHPGLREIALGGPDTATRAQAVWQVLATTAELIKRESAGLKDAVEGRQRVVDRTEAESLKKLHDVTLPAAMEALVVELAKAAPDDEQLQTLSLAWFDAMAALPPRLRAMAARDVADNDACSISPDASYRGRENQLYRVEIHKGGTLADQPTFKWSRENGSVLFAISEGGVVVTESESGKFVTLTVRLQTLGHDRRTGLCVGDWVELSADTFEQRGLAPPLGQVKRLDRAKRSVVVEAAVDAGFKPSTYADCRLLRRWDQVESVGASGTVALKESVDEKEWITLERGVQVQFQPGGVYRTGDHWLIAARVASQDVLWPVDEKKKPNFTAPDGVARHRVAIGHFG